MIDGLASLGEAARLSLARTESASRAEQFGAVLDDASRARPSEGKPQRGGEQGERSTPARVDRRDTNPEPREVDPIEPAEATDRHAEVERSEGRGDEGASGDHESAAESTDVTPEVQGAADERDGDTADAEAPTEGEKGDEADVVDEVADDALIGLKAIGDAIKGTIDAAKAGSLKPVVVPNPTASAATSTAAATSTTAEAPIPVAVISQPNGTTVNGTTPTASVVATAGDESRLSGQTADTGGENAGKREGGGNPQHSSAALSNAANSASSNAGASSSNAEGPKSSLTNVTSEVAAGRAAGSSSESSARAAAPTLGTLAAGSSGGGEGQVSDANTARLARGLRSALSQQGGAVTLRLTPSELGTVRIQLSLSAGRVSAEFQPTTQAGQQMLQGQITQLRASLESQGLAVDRLGVQASGSTSAGVLQQGGAQTGQQFGQQDDEANQQSPTDGRSRGEYGRSGGQSQRDGDPDATPMSFADAFDPEQEITSPAAATAGA
ncbi:MAG: flagellar hook-length control protein FliK [Planctomycetota bacterium]